MLKLLKRLFGCFTKQSANTTDTMMSAPYELYDYI